jgi:Domain of unknown function (DUF4253)
VDPDHVVTIADRTLSTASVTRDRTNGTETCHLRNDVTAVLLWFGVKPDLLTAAAMFRSQAPGLGLTPIVVGSPALDLARIDLDEEPATEDSLELVRANARARLHEGPDTSARDARWRWLPVPEATNGPPYPPTDDRFWITTEPQGTPQLPYQGGSYCLALLDVASTADAVLALNWSDGNTWPAAVHSDLARHWQVAHGAQIAAIDGAWMEMVVPAPVADRSRAFQLAEEQWGYADRIGRPQHGTVNETASALLADRVWTFWWD